MKRLGILFLVLVACTVGCGGGNAGGWVVLSDPAITGNLGRPTPQVVLTVRILEVNQTELSQLGITFPETVTIDGDDGGAQGGVSGDLLDINVRSGAAGGVPDRTHLVLGNYDTNSFLPDFQENFVRPFGITAEFVMLPPFPCVTFAEGNFVEAIGLPDFTLSNLAARDAGIIGGTVDYALYGDLALQALIQDIENNTLGQVITAPEIALFSNQRSITTVQDFTRLLVDLEQDFQDAITPIVLNPIGIFTGSTLDVTPLVVPNSNEVMLDVRFDTRSVSVFLSTPFGNPQGDAELPIVEPSRAHVIVMVPNGTTIVFGGLTRPQSTTTEPGVPVLKDLPLIGNLFGMGDVITRMDTELLVTITPRIIAGP